MTNAKHTPTPNWPMMNFNPNWISNGRFCDGHFQGVKVDVQSIENWMDEIRFAIKARAHNRKPGWQDSYWTAAQIALAEEHYKAALAAAGAQ